MKDQNNPRLYIVSGCNGSGKTTASYKVLPEMLQCRHYVNSDEFAKGLSPFSPRQASVQASRYMLLKIRYLMDHRETFGIETTLATRSLRSIIRNAQQIGYSVTVLYFWLESPELASRRIAARVATGGHDVAPEVVRRRYFLGLHYLFTEYMQMADRWMLLDNTNSDYKMVAQGWKENMIVKDNLKYEEIKTLAFSGQGEDKK